jgi:hypothetical protein
VTPEKKAGIIAKVRQSFTLWGMTVEVDHR